MVQDQLVEYINSQLKAGVSADAVKAALVGAGWQTADVDDTMKKVQAPAAGAASVSSVSAAMKPASASPASSVSSVGSSSSFPQSTAQTKPIGGGPQVIRVSDLVSASADPKPMGIGAAPSEKPSAVSSSFSAAKTDAVMSKIAAGGSRPTIGSAKPVSFSAAVSGIGASGISGSASASVPSSSGISAAGPAKKSHAVVTESILGLLIVLFAAAAAFLFLENHGLSAQIATVNGQSSGVSSQLSSLQAQFNASTSALAAETASTSAENQALLLDLSFYAVPPGAPATTTTASSLSGTVLGGGKYEYSITTAYGAKVYVTNSKNAKVVALLQPLVGQTGPSTFSGTYVPGEDTITIATVNGIDINAPAAATSTGAAATGTTGGTNAPMIPATSTQ